MTLIFYITRLPQTLQPYIQCLFHMFYTIFISSCIYLSNVITELKSLCSVAFPACISLLPTATPQTRPVSLLLTSRCFSDTFKMEKHIKRQKERKMKTLIFQKKEHPVILTEQDQSKGPETLDRFGTKVRSRVVQG